MVRNVSIACLDVRIQTARVNQLPRGRAARRHLLGGGEARPEPGWTGCHGAPRSTRIQAEVIGDQLWGGCGAPGAVAGRLLAVPRGMDPGRLGVAVGRLVPSLAARPPPGPAGGVPHDLDLPPVDEAPQGRPSQGGLPDLSAPAGTEVEDLPAGQRDAERAPRAVPDRLHALPPVSLQDNAAPSPSRAERGAGLRQVPWHSAGRGAPPGGGGKATVPRGGSPGLSECVDGMKRPTFQTRESSAETPDRRRRGHPALRDSREKETEQRTCRTQRQGFRMIFAFAGPAAPARCNRNAPVGFYL